MDLLDFDDRPIDVINITQQDVCQIEMAAIGCISGTLKEWPCLAMAFKNIGISSNPNMESDIMCDICRLILIIRNHLNCN